MTTNEMLNISVSDILPVLPSLPWNQIVESWLLSWKCTSKRGFFIPGSWKTYIKQHENAWGRVDDAFLLNNNGLFAMNTNKTQHFYKSFFRVDIKSIRFFRVISVQSLNVRNISKFCPSFVFGIYIWSRPNSYRKHSCQSWWKSRLIGSNN